MILLLLACSEPTLDREKYEENFFRCLEEAKIETERSYHSVVSAEVIKQCRSAAADLSLRREK